MKTQTKSLLLGSFIFGAILLLVGTLLTVGARNPFRSTGHFVMYLPGSADGLDKGTLVSLNGIRIGQIDQVGVVYNPQNRHTEVTLRCQVDRNRLTDIHGNSIRLTDERVLKHLITEGLSAQIQTSGLVGAKFVNLAFHEPTNGPPPPTGLPRSEYPVIPASPSTMSQITEDASKILADVRKVDFEGLSQQAQELLAKLRLQVAELETNRLTDNLSGAAESIGRLANSTNIQETLSRFQNAAGSLDLLMTNLNDKIIPLGADLSKTLAQGKTTFASVTQTARDLQDFISLRNRLGEQTKDLEEQLTQTARTIENLAGFLQQHPNALITGREQPRGSQ